MAPEYDHLTVLQKVEVFEHAISHTDGDDLAKVLWLKSPSSEVSLIVPRFHWCVYVCLLNVGHRLLVRVGATVHCAALLLLASLFGCGLLGLCG